MPYKVLIVEDEGLIAHDIASRLETLGHTVVGAVSTGAEAIAGAGAADIVLMDIRLDGPMDGIQAAAEIRRRYRLPVVFVTAHTDRSTLEQAKLAEPFGYVVKPVAMAALQTTLELAVYKHGMERRLQESESWLDAVADAVIVTDAEGRVRMCNQAAMVLCGGAPHEIAQVLAEDPVPLAILKDTAIPVESKIGECLVEGLAAPVRAGGMVIGTVLTLRDVSARRRAEQQSRHAQRVEAAGRLAASVAGEYANLLAIIRSQTEQLLDRFEHYSRLRQPLEEIQQAASAADRITRRLAGFNATPLGQTEVLNLNAILRRMLKLVESAAGPRVRVHLRLDAATRKFHGDMAHVEELVMSFVVHASGAMPDDGEVTIETGNVNDQVFLALTHSGAPQDPDALDLAVARYVTGDGNKLEAQFPAWSDPAASAPAADAHPRTILLVESNERVRSELHNFFETNGYNLLEARDAGEAQTLLELQEVDLVIGGGRADGLGEEDVPRLAIARPYSQAALLEQVESALAGRLALGITSSS